MVSQTWSQYLFPFQAVHYYYCSLQAALGTITKLLLLEKKMNQCEHTLLPFSFARMQPELDWAEDALNQQECCSSSHQYEQWCRETPSPKGWPLVLWLHPFCLPTFPQLSPGLRLQPQLHVVRALKSSGNVAQSLCKYDQRAQRASYVPKGIDPRQAAQKISNNCLEKADTSQKNAVGLRGQTQTQRTPDVNKGKSWEIERGPVLKKPFSKGMEKQADECVFVSFGVTFKKYWDRGNTEHARMQSSPISHWPSA